jgi:hypothetical protein
MEESRHACGGREFDVEDTIKRAFQDAEVTTQEFQQAGGFDWDADTEWLITTLVANIYLGWGSEAGEICDPLSEAIFYGRMETHPQCAEDASGSH